MPESEENKESSSPSGLILATQWGANIVVLTCVLGYAGYFIGGQLNNNALAFFLTLGGIMLGFSAGVWRMVKATEKMKSKSLSGQSDKK